MKMNNMYKVSFKSITQDEYLAYKKEIRSKFPYCRVKHNEQQYALGGFNITPKDYENGFNSHQIDEISDYLKLNELDTSYLPIIRNEYYNGLTGNDAIYNGMKMNHITFKDGFYFIKKIGYLDMIDRK